MELVGFMYLFGSEVFGARLLKKRDSDPRIGEGGLLPQPECSACLFGFRACQTPFKDLNNDTTWREGIWWSESLTIDHL